MKIEIKSIGAKSMFKTTLYLASVPLGIMFLVGILALIIGIASGNSKSTMTFIPLVVMPFFMIIVYGLIGMLVSALYNFFANKFGGLELSINVNKIEAPLENNQEIDKSNNT
ncbi:flagellar biosynthesis protein FliQ [Paenibacillus sp. V4I9]|uniref:hypothetical protein n=1 Tax=Paenibacillus sp. V4I9 TaxID=3042308 RepID=UPI002785F5D0|nr:hypothetical protein [Paenibacillus sp. V4I9]MDQ0885079.1 flagellar biosynthesis protein FliQ [Paenibacillus sp. V4I9]